MGECEQAESIRKTDKVSGEPGYPACYSLVFGNWWAKCKGYGFNLVAKLLSNGLKIWSFSGGPRSPYVAPPRVASDLVRLSPYVRLRMLD